MIFELLDKNKNVLIKYLSSDASGELWADYDGKTEQWVLKMPIADFKEVSDQIYSMLKTFDIEEFAK